MCNFHHVLRGAELPTNVLGNFYLYYAQYNKQSFNVFQALPHKLSSATYGYFFGLKIQAKRAKLFHNSRSSK